MSDVTLRAIEDLLDEKLENLPTRQEFRELQTSVENMATDVKTIKQELPVLRAGQERIKTVLVEKEIATAAELSIQQ